MDTKIYLGILICAAMCGGCSNDEEVINEQEQNDSPYVSTVITATVETQTRSTVNDEGSFSWETGDTIKVYTNNEEWRSCTYTDENSFETAFGSNEKTSKVAVYPNLETSLDNNNQLTLTLPVTYQLGSNADDAKSPMLAVIGEEGQTNLRFTHLGGLIRFTINYVPAGACKFVLTTDKKINGSWTVPVVTETPIETSETTTTSEKTTTLEFNALTVAANMTFFVPMPVGTYNTMSIQILNSENQKLFAQSSTLPKEITRRKLLIMNPLEVEATPVTSSNDLQNAINERGSVMLSENISISAAMTVATDADVKIDLGGHTLTLAGGLTNAGTLNITNGTLTAEATNAARRTIINNEGATVILGGDNGNVKIEQTYTSGGSAVRNSGTMIINEGTTIAAANMAISNRDGAEMIINGGTFGGLGEGTPPSYCICNQWGSVITINGGTFEGGHGCLSNTENSAAYVNGGTFTSTGHYAIYSCRELLSSYTSEKIALAKSGENKVVLTGNCSLDGNIADILVSGNCEVVVKGNGVKYNTDKVKCTTSLGDGYTAETGNIGVLTVVND